MDETEATSSELELVEKVRNEVFGEFQSTDIVSEYNMKNISKTGEFSIAKNQEFHIKRQQFIRKCIEKDIFLEGLVTSVFMDDNSLIDVFESGITKAANFSELGDIQTVLRAVSHWCTKLHSTSGKKRRQQTTWFRKNGFKETTFKEIDKQLRNRYTEAGALVSELKRPTILNFNKDVFHVHETMMEIMAKLWYNRLCIYQGHKDLGYMQISSKVHGLIGRKSCYRLTNEPPRFVLALDALNKNHIPQEVNLLVSIGDDLAASILSKYHNTTPNDMVDQFFCILVATEYMSFELGSLASSEKFCERLKVLCGHDIKVLYDRDLKQLSILCPNVNRDRVKSVLERELSSLQMELETKELDIPFPNVHSPLRMQIGEGLQCMGITGFHWFQGKHLQEVHIRKSASISEGTGISPTPEEALLYKLNSKELCDYQHLSATENVEKFDNYTKSLIVSQKNILVDDKVVFDSSVEIILHCLTKDKAKDENESGLMYLKDAKTFVISSLIRVFAEAGLRTDGNKNSTAIWAQANSEYLNQFDLKIVFPNVFAAVAGARCIKSFSNGNFSVFLRHPTKLATDLKTIRIMMTRNCYQVIEKPLEELLGRKKAKNEVEDWIIQDPLSSVNCSNTSLQVLVSATATENCHMHILTQTLKDFFQPVKVTFDNLQLHYLQSNDGTKFLKFLMHFTKTCIYLPEFHKYAYIYGDTSNKNQSASILKRQLAVQVNSCELSWYLFDFDKTCYNSHALKNLFHSMKSHLDKLKCISDISQYFLYEDRPELWLETKADTYSRYSEEIKSTLMQRLDVSVDIKSRSQERICSVCFSEDLQTSNENCYLLSVCGHAYCKECVLQLVIRFTKNRKLPVKCCLQNCQKSLSVAELWYICGVVQYYNIRKILQNVLNTFITDNAASFGLCMRHTCGAMCVVYEQDKMKACLCCRSRFCLQCDKNFHGTKDCGEMWSVKEWLKEVGCSRKRCPNCHIPIEKEGGCNIVFCAWCKKYICWNCGLFHSKCSSECHTHAHLCNQIFR